MPTIVKLKLIFLVFMPSLVLILLPFFLFNTVLAFFIVLLLLLVSVYLLYMYYPPFDFKRDYSIKGKKILLSFDDGLTDGFTDKILDILSTYNIKAIFFAIGSKLEKNLSLAKRVIEEGHVLANHTYTHKKLHLASYQEIDYEISKTQIILDKLYQGQNLKTYRIFRAPHGFKNFNLKKYLKTNKYKLIAWTKGVWDTDAPGCDWIYKHAVQHNNKAQILLLHDGLGFNTVSDRQKEGVLKALPLIIEKYLKDGYEFVSVLDIIK